MIGFLTLGGGFFLFNFFLNVWALTKGHADGLQLPFNAGDHGIRHLEERFIMRHEVIFHIYANAAATIQLPPSPLFPFLKKKHSQIQLHTNAPLIVHLLVFTKSSAYIWFKLSFERIKKKKKTHIQSPHCSNQINSAPPLLPVLQTMLCHMQPFLHPFPHTIISSLS